MGKSGPEVEASCSRLALSLQEDPSAWQTWSAHPQPEAQALPAGFQDQLTSMHKLLVRSQPLLKEFSRAVRQHANRPLKTINVSVCELNKSDGLDDASDCCGAFMGCMHHGITAQRCLLIFMSALPQQFARTRPSWQTSEMIKLVIHGGWDLSPAVLRMLMQLCAEPLMLL